LQRFFFEHGVSSHKTVFEYARGRFTQVFESGDDEGVRPKDLQIYSSVVESDFIEYVDKLVYHSCSGDAAQISALENKKTFIEFLSFCNNYLEKVKRLNAQNDKLNNK